MKNETEDIVYRCKDCIKYNLCSYYYRRKETSQICHYFELKGKTGKWKHIHQWTWDCSECGYRVNAKYFKYCPNCGAKMEVDE